MLGLLLKQIFDAVFYVLSFTLKIPIFLLLLISLWVYCDRHSAIRQAVDNAVVKLVAQSELAAKDELIALKQAQVEQLQRTVQRTEQRLAEEKAANLALEAEKEAAEQTNQSLKEKLDAIPTFDTPVIDQRFYDLLPKRGTKTTE